MASSSFLEAFFYYMVETKFHSENKDNLYLQLYYGVDNLLQIFICNDEKEIALSVSLTIQDIEKLMDHLHLGIIKIEGGK